MNVNCLLYGDDAVLIASSECKLETLVNLKEGCENNGLNLNANKFNVLIFEKTCYFLFEMCFLHLPYWRPVTPGALSDRISGPQKRIYLQ